MADLTAADVTVTVEQRQIVGKQKRNRVKIVFGNGTLTYPAAGVPMPAAEKFGMVRNLEYLTVFDHDDASGLMFKYDKDNNKLRIYWPSGGATNPATAAAEATAILTSGATAVTANAATADIRKGQAAELVGGTSTITAKTLYAEAVGW